MNKEAEKIMRKLQTIAYIQELKKDKKAIFMLALSPQHIKAKETEPFLDVLSGLITDAETVRSLKGRLVLDWTHFEKELNGEDPSDVDYVRTFIQEVSKEFPYWFWFLTKQDFDLSLKSVLYSSVKVDWKKEVRQNNETLVIRSFSTPEMIDFFERNADAVKELQTKFSLTNQEVTDTLKGTERYLRNKLTNFDWSLIPANTFN